MWQAVYYYGEKYQISEHILSQVLGKGGWATRREVQLREVLPDKAVAYRLFGQDYSSQTEGPLEKSEAHIIVTRKSKKVEITAAGCHAMVQELGEIWPLLMSSVPLPVVCSCRKTVRVLLCASVVQRHIHLSSNASGYKKPDLSLLLQGRLAVLLFGFLHPIMLIQGAVPYFTPCPKSPAKGELVRPLQGMQLTACSLWFSQDWLPIPVFRRQTA